MIFFPHQQTLTRCAGWLWGLWGENLYKKISKGKDECDRNAGTIVIIARLLSLHDFHGG